MPPEKGAEALNVLKTSPLEWFGRWQETSEQLGSAAATSSAEDMPSMLGKARPSL